MDVGKAFTLAYEHMVRMLFKPFDYKKWLGLGLVSMLFIMGGGLNVRVPSGNSAPSDASIQSWFAHYWPLLVAAAVAVFVLALVFMWVSSVMRFVYTDQIVRNHGAIREPWSMMKRRGLSFFLWQLALVAVAMVLIAAILIPAIMWIVVSDAELGAKFGVGALAGLALIAVIIVISVVQTLANDFVTVVMYVRNIGVIAAWRTVIPIIRANVGSMVVYLLILILFWIGMGMLAFGAALVLLIPFALPGGFLFGIGYALYTTAGREWSVPLMVYAGIAGLVLALAYYYALFCVLQPGYVLRRAYSLVVFGMADPSLATIGLPPSPATDEGGLESV